MYKPGTQLIITDLWAAAAAHKLGFEVETFEEVDVYPTTPKYILPYRWVKGFQVCNVDFGGSLTVYDKWRITVTESGPNAAERFLPQVDDVLRGLSMPDKYANMINKDFMSEWLRKFSAVKIIKRNGIPFPQFSEESNYKKENNNGLQ